MLKKIFRSKRHSFFIISILLIFLFSLQSGDVSYGLSDLIVNEVQELFEAWGISEYVFRYHGIEYVVRKGAHVVLYLLLGTGVTLVVAEIMKKNDDSKNKKFYLKWIGISFAICSVLACTDECIQMMLPGRQGKFSDVVIDALGYVLGIFLIVMKDKLKMFRKR